MCQYCGYNLHDTLGKLYAVSGSKALPPMSLKKRLKAIPHEARRSHRFWAILSLIITLFTLMMVQNWGAEPIISFGDFLVQMPKNMQRFHDSMPEYGKTKSSARDFDSAAFLAQSQ